MTPQQRVNWAAGPPMKKMQWAIEFTQERFDALPAWQWEYWFDALLNFVGGQLNTAGWTQELVLKCQQEAQKLLGVWADHNEQKNLKSGARRPTYDKVLTSTEGIEQLAFQFHKAGGVDIIPSAASDLCKAFSFRLFGVFGGIDTTILRRCLACRALFLASHGRQRHCSQRCTWTMASARYRAKHGVELKVREYRRTTQPKQARKRG